MTRAIRFFIFLWVVIVAFGYIAVASEAATIDDELSIAHEYWGQAPTNCTSYNIQFAPVLESEDRGQATVPSYPQPCQMWIAYGVLSSESAYCTVVIHEYGHWLGLEHSSDPNSIMYAPVMKVPGVCIAAANNHRRAICLAAGRKWYHNLCWASPRMPLNQGRAIR